MTKNSCFLLLILFVTSCGITKDFETSTGARITDHSLVYALPQTTFTFTIEATKTIHKKGIYAEYAEKYLHLQNVTMSNSQSWALSNVEVESGYEADPLSYFTISYKTYPENIAKLFAISDKGIILDFSSPWKSRTNRSLPIEKTDSLYDPKILRPTQNEKIDTFYKTIVTDSSFHRIPVIKKQLIVKTKEEEAKETAILILKIRKSRVDLLRGKLTYPPDGDALETNLEELNKLENMYMAMFLGTKFEEKKVFTYYFTPNKGQTNNDLCYFSNEKGIQAQPTPGTKPITIQLIKETDSTPASITPNKNLNILYFRIPIMSIISVKYNDEDLAAKRCPIYQFGSVQTFPVKQ